MIGRGPRAAAAVQVREISASTGCVLLFLENPFLAGCMVDTEGASASVCGGTGGVFPQPAEVRRHCPLRHRGPGIPQGHSQSSQARLERQEETATWGEQARTAGSQSKPHATDSATRRSEDRGRVHTGGKAANPSWKPVSHPRPLRLINDSQQRWKPLFGI